MQVNNKARWRLKRATHIGFGDTIFRGQEWCITDAEWDHNKKQMLFKGVSPKNADCSFIGTYPPDVLISVLVYPAPPELPAPPRTRFVYDHGKDPFPTSKDAWKAIKAWFYGR